MDNKFIDIKSKIEQLAEKLGVDKQYLPTYGNWKESHPNIEADISGFLYYEIFERGDQILYYIPLDEDDLLYKVFLDLTYLMMLLNREFIDSFGLRKKTSEYKQEDLLGLLNPKWKERFLKDHSI